MNNKYVTVISRDEFISLYSFGRLENIKRNFILNKNDTVEKDLLELFKMLPFNEASDYLIICINDENYNKDFSKVTYELNLENIERIEVLSEKSERFYRTKVNQKLEYFLTEYTSILPKIEEYQALKNMKRGVEIIFEQFDISKENIKNKLNDESIKRVLEYLKKEDYLKEEFQSLSFDLLSYRRENIFIKEDISFIYDMIIILLLKGRNENRINMFRLGDLSLDKFSTYQLLNTNKQNTLFEYISFILDSGDENIEKFLKQMKKEDLIIGSIFLKIKYLLLHKEENPNYWNEVKFLINDFQKEYKEELSTALYYIGLVFGYKNLYDEYYEFLDNRKKLEKEKNSLQSERDTQIKTLEAEQEAKAELERVQEEKDSKIEELEKVKASLESERDAQTKKLEAEQEAKAELERLQKEKDSKIEGLEKAKAIFESEKEAEIKKLEAEQKAELERLQKEKDSKIEELEKAKATLESEKDAEIKKLKEEQKDKDIEIEELKNPKVTIQELIKVESKVEPQKETIDDILKEIMDVKELQYIIKELNIKSTAKTVGGLKKAIKKACSSDEKIDTLKIIVSQEKGLFA